MKVEVNRCPKCQAEMTSRDHCWLCHNELTVKEEGGIVFGGSESTVNPYSPPVPPAPVGESSEGALAMVLLVVGLVIVMVGLIVIAPGFGILLAIGVTPALVRTAVVVSRRRRSGEAISTGEKSVLFLSSLAAVVTAGVAALAAFGITCAASCFGIIALEATGSSSAQTGFFFVSLFVSSVIGITGGVYTLNRFWRRRDDQPS
jgi:hypothetical protein